jgi:hypothetical protein
MVRQSETFLYRIISESESFLDKIRIRSAVIATPNGTSGRLEILKKVWNAVMIQI